MLDKIRAFLLKMVKKYMLPQHKFYKDDIIKSELGDAKYRVEGLCYDVNLQPVVIVIDENGRWGAIPEAYLVKTKEVVNPDEVSFI